MVASMVTSSLAGTDMPLIGIFAQPHDSSHCPNGKSCQYIAASYIKYVESFGARAVPVSYYADNATIETLFTGLNGVLFPGGGASVPEGAAKMYELAIAANDAGDSFPLWGTCLGFEWLVQLAGGTLDTGFDSENITLPLVMTDAALTSKLFSSLDPALYAMLQSNQTSALNNHGAGITPTHFAAQPVSEIFTVLSTSFDRNGAEFVSTMEAKDYPFYGVQWHPEKNVWELGKYPDGMPYEAIPHTVEAMDTTLYMAKQLVLEARKNNHAFPDQATESAVLIWNYPVFVTGMEFVQEYIADF
eukprot:CAMPEP_0119542538 /NCGR_PEP_ID=MMETSP1344-20130328/53640_1 /TAXON_ID=236787 /ORGANISM="Florenciella parvula, Strain CCMP2471" /LENGTH=301 /DNA_ID=CAMNT_0007586769 /DNA_START=75 /DNA_END=980 /DNA_ORIENTATION=+